MRKSSPVRRGKERPGGGPRKVNSEDTPLWRCLRQEDFAGAGRLIRAGAAAVEQTDATFGWTPLLFGANAGELRFLAGLLDRHANIDAACSEGNQAVTLAARRGHVDAVNLLIRRSADLDVPNIRGWTPLMWTSMTGEGEAAAALLEAQANTRARDKQGRSASMWAARHGHRVIVEELLTKGFDLDARDADGLSALEHASDHLELKAAMVLCEEKARRLLDAAQRNDPEAAEEALEDGAANGARDAQGWTPLMWAALHDSAELASTLVRYGANPSLLGEEAALGEQLAAPQVAVSETLQHVLDSNRNLLLAARRRDWADANMQLNLGCFVDAREDGEDARGRTALMWAARAGDLEGIELLVDSRAAMNLQDAAGYSAFLFAVLSGSVEAVALLHHCDADHTIRSYEGDSALHLAVRGDSSAMIQTLLAAEANIEELDYRHNTPLHLAAFTASCQSLNTLLYFSADTLALDASERIPLALAVAFGQLSVCEAMFAELQDLPALPSIFPELEAQRQQQRQQEAEGSDKPGEPGATGAEAEAEAAGKSDKDRGERGGVAAAPASPPKTRRKSKAGAAQGSPGKGKRNPVRRTSKASVKPTPKNREELREHATDDDDSSKASVDLDELAARHQLNLLWTAAKKREDQMLYPVDIETRRMLSAADADGRSPLHLASRGRNLPIMKLLLNNKADASACDNFGRSPLADAAVFGHRDVVEDLLEAAADVTLRDADGRRAVDLSQDGAITGMLERAEVAGSRRVRGSQLSREPDVAQGPPVGIFRVRLEDLPKRVPGDVLAAELRSLLRNLGTKRPVNLEVVMDLVTGRPRGIAYVDFTDQEAADRAMLCEGKEVLGSVVRAVRDQPAAMVR